MAPGTSPFVFLVPSLPLFPQSWPCCLLTCTHLSSGNVYPPASICFYTTPFMPFPFPSLNPTILDGTEQTTGQGHAAIHLSSHFVLGDCRVPVKHCGISARKPSTCATDRLWQPHFAYARGSAATHRRAFVLARAALALLAARCAYRRARRSCAWRVERRTRVTGGENGGAPRIIACLLLLLLLLVVAYTYLALHFKQT